MAFGRPTWGVRRELAAHLQNGVGRYVCQLQRLTIKFCKQRGDSRGVRDFIEHEVIDFARKNPGIVVYLKPRRNRAPILVGEYLSGRVQIMPVAKLRQTTIGQWVEVMRCRGGEDFDIISHQHSVTPSIQGMWTPWTNRPTHVNTLTHFPDPVRARPHRYEPSASEVLMDMAREQELLQRDGESSDGAGVRQQQAANVVVGDEDDADYEDYDDYDEDFEDHEDEEGDRDEDDYDDEDEDDDCNT